MSKYFTLSFDDGLEQDKEIIRILKAAGLNCATFNLNSALMGQKNAIGRIKDYGYKVVPAENGVLPENTPVARYHRDFRIPADEIPSVYEGFEIASHGLTHKNLSKASEDEIRQEICDDKEALEKLTGKRVRGFIYPFGAVSSTAASIVKDSGFSYTRGVKSTKKFDVPRDFLTFQPTCWQIEKDLLKLARDFVNAPDEGKDMLFYVWGHGYEMDFGTPNSGYDRFKALLHIICKKGDIICMNNGDTVEALGR